MIAFHVMFWNKCKAARQDSGFVNKIGKATKRYEIKCMAQFGIISSKYDNYLVNNRKINYKIITNNIITYHKERMVKKKRIQKKDNV